MDPTGFLRVGESSAQVTLPQPNTPIEQHTPPNVSERADPPPPPPPPPLALSIAGRQGNRRSLSIDNRLFFLHSRPPQGKRRSMEDETVIRLDLNSLLAEDLHSAGA